MLIYWEELNVDIIGDVKGHTACVAAIACPVEIIPSARICECWWYMYVEITLSRLYQEYMSSGQKGESPRL